MQKAKDLAFKKAKEILKSQLTNVAVSTFCDTVYDGMISKTNPSAFSVDTLVSAVDVFGIKNMVNDCKDTSTTNGQVACAKTFISAAAVVDPTGLFTIAATFMKPTCEDNTVNAAELESMVTEMSETEIMTPDKKAEQIVQKLKPECIMFFDKADFQGKSEVVCETNRDLKSKITA